MFALKQFGIGISTTNLYACILRFPFIIDISKFFGTTDSDKDYDKTVTISHQLMYFVLSLATDIFCVHII